MDIIVYYAPYSAKNCQRTYLGIEGIDYTVENKRFASYVANKPMAQWLLPYTVRLFHWHGILPELLEELNDSNISFTFFGRASDYEVFDREIGVQAAELSSQYSSGLQVKTAYKGNLCEEDFGARLISVINQTVDAYSTKRTHELLKIKRELKDASDYTPGCWTAQINLNDHQKQVLFDAGLVPDADNALMDVMILDGRLSAGEHAEFCEKHALRSWNQSLSDKLVYLLVNDQQEGESAVQAVRAAMRERGYCMHHVAYVLSLTEIAEDVKRYDYFQEIYSPGVYGRAINALFAVQEEIPKDVAECELGAAICWLERIRRPARWIQEVYKR